MCTRSEFGGWLHTGGLLVICLLLSTCTGHQQRAAEPAIESRLRGGLVVGIPAPSAIHCTSGAGEVLARSGSDFSAGLLPVSHVVAAGQKGMFSPDWDPGLNDGIGGLAYALYTFNLPGGSQGRYLQTAWPVVPLSGSFWIGLGNRVLDRWDWFAGEANDELLIPAIDPYLDADGGLLLVVLLTGTRECLLQNINVGGQPPSVVSVSPSFGEPGELTSFEAVVAGTEPISYLWDFESAAVPSTANTAKADVYLGAIGNYTAQLHLSNALGDCDYSFPVVVGLPRINGVQPISGLAGANVTFGASVDSVSPVNYSWDFGGAAVPDQSGDKKPAVVLGNQGIYQATLTVSNKNGQAEFPFELLVKGPPTANLVAVPASGPSPLSVQFDAGLSSDSDGVIVDYTWHWGDGSPDYDSGPQAGAQHVYDSSGQYATWTARLTVTDDDGMTGTATTIVTAQGWQEYRVDELHRAGATSIELNQAGEPRIAHYDDDSDANLRFSWETGGVWQSEVVDPDNQTGTYVSMRLTTDGYASIAYYYWNADAADSDLRYARQGGAGWVIEDVDTVGRPGRYCSLELDTLEQPHISYSGSNQSALKYAWRDGSGWHWQNVFIIPTVATSLALDSQDKPLIAYKNGNNLCLASKPSGTWGSEVIDWVGVLGGSCSLICTPDDVRHISFFDTDWIEYGINSGAGWQNENVDGDKVEVGKENQLRLGQDGEPHIAYWDTVNGYLKYAVHSPAGWTIQVVAPDCTGHVSLALDAAGQPYISYTAWNNLMIAHWKE